MLIEIFSFENIYKKLQLLDIYITLLNKNKYS
jgi:hypothetical protein